MIRNTLDLRITQQLEDSTDGHERSASHTPSITIQGDPRGSGTTDGSSFPYPPFPFLESGGETVDVPTPSGASISSPSSLTEEAASHSTRLEEMEQKPGRAVLLVEDNQVNLKVSA
jgi:hypothetical protein